MEKLDEKINEKGQLYTKKQYFCTHIRIKVMKKKELYGMGVALVTPFKSDGSVDYAALDHLVDYQLFSGANFLCVLGTTAETPTLTAEEAQKVREAVIARNAGRLPIMLGVGGNCTQAVVDKLANDPMEGVDAILSVVPYYNKPTQKGLIAHFSAIAKASPRPVVLYNVPGRTGVNMLPDTTLELAWECENIIGIKEASGKIAQIEEILLRRPETFKVFSGDDALTLHLLNNGADGVISVIGNALSVEFGLMTRMALAGDMEKATIIDETLRPVYDLLFRDGNPAGIKALMYIRGLIDNVLRLPLVPASESTMDGFRMFLSTFIDG